MPTVAAPKLSSPMLISHVALQVVFPRKCHAAGTAADAVSRKVVVVSVGDGRGGGAGWAFKWLNWSGEWGMRQLTLSMVHTLV